MNQTNKIYDPQLKNVSETLLVPLFFKAKETKENGKIKDEKAVDIVNRIEYDFDRMSKDKTTQSIIVIRTEIIDKIVEEYVDKTPHPVIINLGAGLDTRHLRFKKAKWYQLDLERPMELRKFFFEDEQQITKSILDYSWVKEIKEKEEVLIIIEGVLMYLDEKQIASMFSTLGEHFKNSQVVFDTIPPGLTKLKKHKSIKLNQAPFKWGNSKIIEIERWHHHLKVIKNYYYLAKMIRRGNFFSLISFLPHIYKGFKISLVQIHE